MKGFQNKKVVITGGSGGLGERIAWRVAENGGVPIIIARSQRNLEKVQREIRTKYNINSFWYQADLANNGEIEKVLHDVIKDQGTIHALVNNAGFGKFSLVEESNWEETQRMFQLNVFALIQGIEAILPHFRKNEAGHIINIGSQAGKIATPKSAAYAATKHAVLGYTNALRLEVEGTGIHVTSVNIGPMRTNFFETADPSGNYLLAVGKFMLDPDVVAKKIVRTLFKRRREINMPLWMEGGSRLYHLFPSLIEQMLRGQFNKK